VGQIAGAGHHVGLGMTIAAVPALQLAGLGDLTSTVMKTILTLLMGSGSVVASFRQYVTDAPHRWAARKVRDLPKPQRPSRHICKQENGKP
jgi:hypothetical protein